MLSKKLKNDLNKAEQTVQFLPVPRKIFIFDLENLVSDLFCGQKLFVKFLNKAEKFLKVFISHLISDQKLAESRLFLLRKNSLTNS